MGGSGLKGGQSAWSLGSGEVQDLWAGGKAGEGADGGMTNGKGKARKAKRAKVSFFGFCFRSSTFFIDSHFDLVFVFCFLFLNSYFCFFFLAISTMVSLGSGRIEAGARTNGIAGNQRNRKEY